LTMMAELDARDVVRNCALARRDVLHLARRHEQERRRLVDEPADQPGARDAIDTRLLTGDPLHRPPPFALPRVVTGTTNIADPCDAGPFQTTAILHSPARGSVIAPTYRPGTSARDSRAAARIGWLLTARNVAVNVGAPASISRLCGAESNSSTNRFSPVVHSATGLSNVITMSRTL